MNRTGIFLLVAIIVAAGAGYWYMNRSKPADTVADPAVATDPATTEPAAGATDPAADPAAPTDPAAVPSDPTAAPADGAPAPDAQPAPPAAPPPPGDPTQQ